MRDYKNYYYADIYFSKKNAAGAIVILAQDIKEAEKRYDECVKRHKNISALDDRNITLAGNITYLFSDYPNVKEELSVYGSALI